MAARSQPIAIALALFAFATPARAQNIVCDNVLPPLRTFGVVADQLITKLSPSGDPGEPWGTSVYRLACTRRAKIAGTWIDPSIIATETSGAAIRFTHGTIAGSICWNRIFDDVITGGGGVTGIDPQCIDGMTDTSGTHPLVADCNQAFADRQAASDFFASQPPARELGTLVVPVFTTYTLTTAPNEVVHLDSLDVKGGYDPDFPLLCYDYTALELAGGPAVVNVDRVEIGPCVLVQVLDAVVVLNVSGRGRPIKIGRGAVVEAPILAPARSVSVRGTVDDGITFVGPTFARRLKMTGLSSLEHPFPSCN